MAKDSGLTVDPDLVRQLARLLGETELSEIEYAVGDRRIRVARHSAPMAVPVAAPLAGAAAAAPADAAASATGELPGTVKSPMVGTIYLAPEPAAAPFVKLGDSVAENQVLLIIEAMKVMNQIHAPRAGKLTRILVEDGAPVEYGQPLLVVE